MFFRFEMVKKRTVKKRLQRRLGAHSEKGKNDKKPDVSKMSRMEYEQSMMDPRFRAAMMGFNAQAGGNQLLQIRELETKQNELTRQAAFQEQIDNMKKHIDEMSKEQKKKATELKEKEITEKHEAEKAEAKHKLRKTEEEAEHFETMAPIKRNITNVSNQMEMNEMTHKHGMEAMNVLHQMEMLSL